MQRETETLAAEVDPQNGTRGLRNTMKEEAPFMAPLHFVIQRRWEVPRALRQDLRLRLRGWERGIDGRRRAEGSRDSRRATKLSTPWLREVGVSVQAGEEKVKRVDLVWRGEQTCPHDRRDFPSTTRNLYHFEFYPLRCRHVRTIQFGRPRSKHPFFIFFYLLSLQIWAAPSLTFQSQIFFLSALF